MTNNYNLKPLKSCIKIRMNQKLYLVSIVVSKRKFRKITIYKFMNCKLCRHATTKTIKNEFSARF